MGPNTQTLKIIHFALIMGALMQLTVFIIFLVDLNTLVFDFRSIFLYVLLFMWVVIPFAGKFVYDNIKKNVLEEDHDTRKIQQYTSAKIIVWASLEGLALFSAVLLMLEPNFMFLVSALCAIGLLVLKRISPEEMKRDFKITNELK